MLVDISSARGVKAGCVVVFQNTDVVQMKRAHLTQYALAYPKASSPTLGAKIVTQSAGDPVPPGITPGILMPISSGSKAYHW